MNGPRANTWAQFLEAAHEFEGNLCATHTPGMLLGRVIVALVLQSFLHFRQPLMIAHRVTYLAGPRAARRVTGGLAGAVTCLMDISDARCHPPDRGNKAQQSGGSEPRAMSV